MIRTILAAAALAALAASPAIARDREFSAKLSVPVAEHTRVVAERTVWQCEGDTCRAVADHPATVRTCRSFVREAGPVTAYGFAGSELNADQLAQCNASARQASARTIVQASN
ncbi:MAG: hypothetical protein NW203_13005 [Hyphomonadaceae bacterium]|nr:hypothetical protein [Hyphomonadaceae bacterium]